ncbi:MAG: antibiotic biosynthesis monooxygenase [Ferruginibacter sp.]
MINGHGYKNESLNRPLTMIARTWHGRTSIKNFDAYSDVLKKIAIPDYEKTPGFKGLAFLRNIKDGESHFTLISFWENLEVIKSFAGEDVEKARYYTEDNNFLLDFEEKVEHKEVFAMQ